MIAQASQSSDSTTARSARVARAFSEPIRQELLQLVIQEELTVSELVQVLGVPQSTVSRHLKVLREAVLVRDRRAGQMVIYQATPTDAADDGLDAVMIDWLRGRPLTEPLAGRLARVLERRRSGSIGFFERLGDQWDELRAAAFGHTFGLEAMMSLLPPNWTVADVGCGTGFLLPALARRFRHVIAVEPASAMLECARRRVAARNLSNVDFRQGDLSRIPIDDATCDLVIAALVIHHVVDPAESPAELHRVIRPGGRLLVVEQHVHEDEVFYRTMQDHWWGFEPDELAAQLSGVGFVRVEWHDLETRSEGKPIMKAPGLFVMTGARASGGINEKKERKAAQTGPLAGHGEER